MVNHNVVKRYDWTVSTANSASGTLTAQYTDHPLNGQLLGFEVGSPAFSTNTGSLWLSVSGINYGRRIWEWNGVPQTNTIIYPKSVIRSSTDASTPSQASGNIWVSEIVASDVLFVAGSGVYSGTSVPISIYYQT